MSQEFLARILEQKAREVEQMELEEIAPAPDLSLGRIFEESSRPFTGNR